LVAVTALAPAMKAAMLRIGARDLRRRPPGPLQTDAGALLNRQRDFPIYRMPTDVLNSLSQAIPVLLLAALFSPAAAGLYALTRSVLNLPSNIIGAAVGNVLYARFAELSREGKPLLPLLLRATGALLALAPVIIGLAWFAPPVFAFVFGDEWREAGHYAQWMALWLGVALANIPAVRLAPVIKAQSLLLVANILTLAARAAAMFGVAWTEGSAGTAVAVFSVVSLIANAVLIFALVQHCPKRSRTSK
jgi:O-antigen/teichoic acid export membrane protein